MGLTIAVINPLSNDRLRTTSKNPDARDNKRMVCSKALDDSTQPHKSESQRYQADLEKKDYVILNTPCRYRVFRQT